ncbi:MAG: alpha/beta hydrolase [Pseudomonadota bacterium]
MVQTIIFEARDGYLLSGTLWRPAGEPRAGPLVTSATGFRQSFYKSFADYAASRGCVVLTYDARGIGASAPDRLDTFNMHYTDWGWHDMPAALETLGEHARGLNLMHMGHSVGGHFVGLWDNFDRVAAHAFVCAGSGYWRLHQMPSPLFEYYFWRLYGPFAIKRYGYVPRGAG